ncbi:sensor histidine kinase [Paenibacillus flagellatus]|uniref:histidine kinase n=1 Tax=Paenibacillus flagellatus TaxID=2211139 RepID=A0A2V5K089_9BACL|nr:HAMP domain-containing sensor histidine kinase [Paenibacillus flagellatus]PYI52491.1 two-component sensor histidine kinase [Paenibacillus flagellatus]
MSSGKGVLLLLLQGTAAAVLLLSELAGQPLGFGRGALFGVLFVCTIALLSGQLRFSSRLRRMKAELARARSGNWNARLLTNGDRSLDDVVFSVNEWIEKLEEIQIRTARSEAARKSLLSNISHDIRTPLSSIIGYADALKDDVAATPEQKKEYIEVISDKARSLKRVIDDMFQMAKLDADEMPLTMEPVDFAEVVRESLIEILPDVQLHGLELHVRLPDDPCVVEADRIGLLRLTGNILKNAVHYGRDGGAVGVEMSEGAEEVTLLIWDRGAGIAEADLPRVFERTYRTDRARRAQTGGSGLGLAIAKALADKHGGKLWAESVPGERTTFGLVLPKRGPSANGIKKPLRDG